MNVEETGTTIHKLAGGGSLWTRVQAQPIEWKLHWLLRIGVFMEFVGHGAFGLKTKAGWLAYFHVFGIADDVAWRWMPIIGAIDVFRFVCFAAMIGLNVSVKLPIDRRERCSYFP